MGRGERVRARQGKKGPKLNRDGPPAEIDPALILLLLLTLAAPEIMIPAEAIVGGGLAVAPIL